MAVLCLFYVKRGITVTDNYLMVTMIGFIFLILPGLPWTFALKDCFPLKRYFLLPFSMLLSLMLYFPFIFLGYLFRLPSKLVILLMFFAGILTSGAGIVFILSRRRQLSSAGIPSLIKSKRDDTTFQTLTLFLIILIALTAFSGTFLSGGDGWLHISIINKIPQRGRMINASPYFASENPDSNYAYCIWHVSLAMLSHITGREAVTIWFSMMPLLMFLTGYSLFGFGLYLYRKPQYAGIFLIAHIWAISHFSGRLVGLKVLQYPYLVGPLILMPVTWLLCLEYMRKGKKVTGTLAVMACIILFFVHKLSFLGFFLMLSMVCLLKIFLEKRETRIRFRPALFWGVLTFLLFVFYLVINPQKITNPIHMNFASDQVLSIGTWGMIAKPEVFLRRAGWLLHHHSTTILPFFAIAALPLTAWRLWRDRKKGAVLNPACVYSLGGMLLIPLVMANPVIGKLFADHFTRQGLMRLYSVLPHFAAVIAGSQIILLLLRKALTSQSLKKRLSFMPTAALVVILLSFSARSYRDFKDFIKKPSYLENWLEKDPVPIVLDRIERMFVHPLVIAANFPRGHFITAMTQHYVLMPPRYITSPSMKDYKERSIARNQFFDPETQPDVKGRIIDKYQIRLILLDYRTYKEQKPEEFLNNFHAEGYILRELFQQDRVYCYMIINSAR